MSNLLYEEITNQLPSLPSDWQISDIEKCGKTILWDEQQDAVVAGIKLLKYYYDEVHVKYTKSETDDVNKTRKQKVFERLKSEDSSIKDEPRLKIKENDSMYNEMLQYFEQDTITRNTPIPYHNFVNRMAFWMATGSGKSFVIIKLIEILDNLMKKDLIPENNILILTENDGLLKQIEKTIKIFNAGSSKKIKLITLKEYPEQSSKSNEIIVYTYLSRNITDKRKDVQLGYSDFEHNGEWYVFLDEAHKGSSSDDAKRMKYVKIISRNGFLFNFSATFTELEDRLTTVYNFNLEKMTTAGYGKNLYLSVDEANIRNFTKDEKKKIVLKSLLTVILLSKIKKEIDVKTKIETYHKPALVVFTGSVSTQSSDLELFFKTVREISLDQLQGRRTRLLLFGSNLFEQAKNELIVELENKSKFIFQEKNLSLDSPTRQILKNITKNDMFEQIFNSSKKGEFEWAVVGEEDKPELLFKHKNSTKPFAIINIGEDGIDAWREKLNHLDMQEIPQIDNKSWFDEASADKNDVNIIMGSRKFYEGWDTVRPNVLFFVGIGVGDAQKFVLQSIGRGIRIKPLKHEDHRQRIKFLRNKDPKAKEILDNTNIAQGNLSYLETLFITGTNRRNLQEIFETVKESSRNITTISLNLTTPTISEILIPKYKKVPDGSISLGDLPHFDGNDQEIKSYLDWLDSDKAKLGNFSDCDGFDDKTLDNLDEYISDASNFDQPSDLPSVEEQVTRLIKHIKVVPYELDSFKKIDDEINHFKEIKITDAHHDTPENWIGKKIKDSIEASNISETEDELDELMEQGSISIKEYKQKLGLLALQDQTHKEITIKHLKNHYFTPIIYGDGRNITSIKPIISEKSEKEFIDDLLGCINDPNSKLNDDTFDEWMFSRIQQNTDNVFVPYYDSQRNRMGRFYPDFIFWFKKDDQYFIVFIDPKGIAHSDYKRKSDGFNEIFDNNPYPHEQLEVTVKNWFYTKDKSQVPYSDQPLWKDSFEEILQDLPFS